MTTVEITIADLEDTRQVLAATLTFFQARDMMEAQARFAPRLSSPLTNEVERLKTRFDNYMADLLLAERDQAEDLAPVEVEEPEPEEPLSDSPLGVRTLPKQEGRKLTRQELSETLIDNSEDGLD